VSSDGRRSARWRPLPAAAGPLPSTPVIKALVLAAGRGERLRPLTNRRPKPLLPVAGRSILAHTLSELAELGCREVAINLHHLGDQIVEVIGSRDGQLAITYAREATLLGTLGALGPLSGFLADADVILVINGDSLCPWPLRRLLREHQESGAVATLLLARHADPRRFGGGVGVDAAGRVLSFRAAESLVPGGEITTRRVFAGAHFLSPALLSRVPERPADFVADLYEPLLAEGALLRSVTTGLRWHDLGTPERYLDGVLDWVANTRGGRHAGGTWTSERSLVLPGSRLDATVLETGVEVGASAYLQRVVALAGARVGEGAVLRNVILGEGAVVAPGVKLERVLVVPARDAGQLPAGAEVIGTHVHVRLGA
jgi:mannose-1-phosphate guanylyltransferase